MLSQSPIDLMCHQHTNHQWAFTTHKIDFVRCHCHVEVGMHCDGKEGQSLLPDKTDVKSMDLITILPMLVDG